MIEDFFPSAIKLIRPGDTLVMPDGSTHVVTCVWDSGVVYNDPEERVLRERHLKNFTEVDQSRWALLSDQGISDLKTTAASHLREYQVHLSESYLAAEAYLASVQVTPTVWRILINTKIAFITEWAARFLSTRPSREQAEAIGTVAGNTIVTARAGSGKTATLVGRTIFLIDQCKVTPNRILLLAFNKKAALEIRRRILRILRPEAEDEVYRLIEEAEQESKKHSRRFNAIDAEATAIQSVVRNRGLALPHAMTFHALAYRLTHPEESLIYDTKDGIQAQSRIVQDIIDQWLLDPHKHEMIRKTMLEHFRQDWNAIVLKGTARERDSFLAYRRSILTESLNGEYVKSFGEKLIADFLFEHDITYKYERNYNVANGLNLKPDFTAFYPNNLRPPARNKFVVIEYFGLAGEPDYDELTEEKQCYWANSSEADFLQYFPSQISSLGPDGFLDRLKNDLETLGLRCNRLSEDEIWNRARTRIIDGFTKVVKTFISRCRKLGLTPPDLEAMMRGHQALHDTENRFNQIASGIYADYLETLAAYNLEDFDGMMLRAANAVQHLKTDFSSRDEAGDLMEIEHVSIDEFQDFSELFYRLVSASQAANPKLKFFCVGDDWQAINGFAGSDLKFFQGFDTFFERPTWLNLSSNYRSKGAIVEVGNCLMRGRGLPSKAMSKEAGDVILSDLAEFRPTEAEKNRHLDDEITPALLRIVHHEQGGRNLVSILARRNGLPYFVNLGHSEGTSRSLDAFKDSLNFFLNKFSEKTVDVSTAHSYKGLENHTVIIVDAVERSYPLIHPHWVFTRIFGDSLENLVDEERRLFYVALTRAVNKVVIITDGKQKSQFLCDIELSSPFKTLNWDDYPAPKFIGKYIYTQIMCTGSGAGTFAIKDIIKASRYKWQTTPLKCWKKTWLRDEFSLEAVQREPWCREAQGVIVSVLRDDEADEHYSVSKGELTRLFP